MRASDWGNPRINQSFVFCTLKRAYMRKPFFRAEFTRYVCMCVCNLLIMHSKTCSLLRSLAPGEFADSGMRSE